MTTTLPWAPGLDPAYPIRNIRQVAQMRTGHTPSRTKQEYWENPSIPWFTLADVWQLRNDQRYLGETKELISPLGLANSAAELLPAGTVVLSRTASVGFTGIMPSPMATSQDFWNWVCGPKMLPVFLWYQMRAMRPEFDRLKSGSTHKTIYQSDAAGLGVVVPPIDTQRQIADYLDHETAEIDAFVAELGDLKALELERRSASVSDIVWGASAQYLRTKFVADILSGFPYRSEDFVSRGSGSFRLLRGVNVGVGCIDWSDSVSAPATVIASTPEYGLQDGDLVLGLDRPVIRAGVRVALIDHASAGSYLLQRVARLRGVPGRALNRWLLHALQDRRFIAYLEPDFTGVSVPHISPAQVGEFRVPVPELDDQVRRLGLIDAIEVACDRAIADTDAAIALAKERRAALITAAVTGQIDVTARHKPVVDSIQSSIEETR